MKKRDLQNMATKSAEELEQKSIDLIKSVEEARMELKLGRATNVHQTKSIRRELAQVFTIMRNKKLTIKKETKKDKTKKLEVKNGSN